MNATQTTPRSLWLVAGMVLVLAGTGAVTFGLLDDAPEPEPEPGAAGMPRADTHLGFLLGGLVVGVTGLVLVYRATT